MTTPQCITCGVRHGRHSVVPCTRAFHCVNAARFLDSLAPNTDRQREIAAAWLKRAPGATVAEVAASIGISGGRLSALLQRWGMYTATDHRAACALAMRKRGQP